MVEFESQPGVKIRYALIAISVLSWAKHPGYRDNRSDLCRVGELVLSAAGYVDKRAPFHKLLRCGEADAGAAARDKGNLTFKFLLYC
jgi:hypothetical protein